MARIAVFAAGTPAANNGLSTAQIPGSALASCGYSGVGRRPCLDGPLLAGASQANEEQVVLKASR